MAFLSLLFMFCFCLILIYLSHIPISNQGKILEKILNKFSFMLLNDITLWHFIQSFVRVYIVLIFFIFEVESLINTVLRLRHKLVFLQKGYILLSLLPTKYITLPNIIQIFYKKGVFWGNEMCTSIYVGCMRKLKDKGETLLKLLSGIPSL